MRFYNEMCEKLRRGEPFKFSRWGDGEWGCMKGWKGKNRDGNEYTPQLRQELQAILYGEQDYYFGLQYGVLYNPELRDYVFNILFTDKHNWVNGDVLHQASEYGYLGEFINALRDRIVVIIGAKYFSKLPYNHIVTPDINSYPDNDYILRSTEYFSPFDDPVYLVASAMNSNVIIDELPDRVTAIDIGSVFDPYLGRPRARYQHKLKAEWLW